jgi:hypothetical protein
MCRDPAVMASAGAPIAMVRRLPGAIAGRPAVVVPRTAGRP